MHLNAPRGHMNRRRFLGVLGLGTTGLSLLDGTIFAPPANAIAPMVVIAIVQTAISIVKLFSSKEGDQASQVGSMLAAISRELVAIEAGIQEILKRLDEIKELIGEIPSFGGVSCSKHVVRLHSRNCICFISAGFDQRCPRRTPLANFA